MHVFCILILKRLLSKGNCKIEREHLSLKFVVVVNVSHKIQAVKNSQFLVLVINYGVKCPVLFCCILVNMVRKYKEGQKEENSEQLIFKMLLGKLTKTKEAFVQLLKKLGFVM